MRKGIVYHLLLWIGQFNVFLQELQLVTVTYLVINVRLQYGVCVDAGQAKELRAKHNLIEANWC